MTDTITSLIEKLEGAEAGSRELDSLIVEALTLAPEGALRMHGIEHGTWATGAYTTWVAPKYSVSLDAALALAERVLPGHDWSLGHLPTSDDADHQEHHEFGCFFYAHPHVASRQDGLGHGATAPLAMVTAILRAQSEAR